MQNHWDLGRWGKIPVSMHWTVLMAFPWLFLWMRDVVGAAIGTVAFLVLQMAHEFGHVWAARWRKVPVYSITLTGFHGETARGHARTAKDEVIIAWGGVAAQLVILAGTLAAMPLLASIESRVFQVVAGPIFIVWTQWNIFLVIVALLPIGPMDGHAAWRVIPLIRNSFARRPTSSSQKVVKLSEARKRELARDSERKASEIIDRLKRK